MSNQINKSQATIITADMLSMGISDSRSLFIYGVIYGMTKHNGTGYIGTWESLIERYNLPQYDFEEVASVLFDELVMNNYIDVYPFGNGNYIFTTNIKRDEHDEARMYWNKQLKEGNYIPPTVREFL